LRHRLLSTAGWLAPGLQLKPGELRLDHRSPEQDTDYSPIMLDAMIDLAHAVARVG